MVRAMNLNDGSVHPFVNNPIRAHTGALPANCLVVGLYTYYYIDHVTAKHRWTVHMQRDNCLSEQKDTHELAIMHSIESNVIGNTHDGYSSIHAYRMQFV